MFKYVMRFIKALNANAHPGDIGHAVALGVMLALIPRSNLLWPFLFILTLFIRMNKGAFFLSLILFSFLTPLADIPLERFGYTLLSIPVMQPVYTVLYNTPFVGLTRFNNTLVAGALAAGILLYIPMYILTRVLLSVYRRKLQPLITGSKLYKFFVKIPLIKKIRTASRLGGDL